MTIDLVPLADLDADQVAANLAILTEIVQEALPTLDTRLGPIRDIVLYLHGALTTQRQQQLSDYQAGRSLLALLNDPEGADASLVDDATSNYLLTRRVGTAAAGTITIVLSAATTVVLGQGAIFTANGQTFASDATYTAKVEEDQVLAADDRLLRAVGNQFAFDISATAVAVGAAGNITRGTAVTPAIVPVGFVASYASDDFTGGTDTETNTDLLGRLTQGAAARTISNRMTMGAFLRAIPAFADVVASSVIGYGDAEMLRDRHWIWPVSGGGRVDWYVRTDERVSQTLLSSVSATLVSKTDDGFGIWQFGVARNTAPGFYEVSQIVPAGSTETGAGYEVVADTRGVDLSSVNYNYVVPDVANITEGAYSRYQTAVIQFKDTSTLTAALDLGATREYDVALAGLTRIASVQDVVADREHASYGADALVRAPIPCFVELTFSLYRAKGATAPDLDVLKTALCLAVNRTGFTGNLYASSLAAVVAANVPAGVTVGAIAMLGRLRKPAGTTTYLSSSEVLTVPDEPSNSVTRRTVQFFVAPAAIAITVVAVAASASA